MVISLVFWLLTLAGCAYAAAYGQKAGKIGAALVVLVVAGTIAATWPVSSWIRPNRWLLLVDGLYFASLYVLAVRSHRYWPIWAAGFQLLSLLTHVAKIIDPTVLPRLYQGLEQCWSIPIMVSMIMGIRLDRKAQLKQKWG